MSNLCGKMYERDVGLRKGKNSQIGSADKLLQPIVADDEYTGLVVDRPVQIC
jgi:hypothetical protein